MIVKIWPKSASSFPTEKVNPSVSYFMYLIIEIRPAYPTNLNADSLKASLTLSRASNTYLDLGRARSMVRISMRLLKELQVRNYRFERAPKLRLGKQTERKDENTETPGCFLRTSGRTEMNYGR